MSKNAGEAKKQQTLLHQTAAGCILAMDSAYLVCSDNKHDVVVNASYCGVLPARFIARHGPRGSIGVDCAVGPAGASIAGLWYLEALQVPAAAAKVDAVILGDGVDLYQNGFVSFLNDPAARVGVTRGMAVKEAALCMLENIPNTPNAENITNRKEVYRNKTGRAVVCLDSIAFASEEDSHNVLVTAGHSGRSALPYLLKVRPHAFICSDGGMGREESGVAGMYEAAKHGLAGAAVDARGAMMGVGTSTYEDGVISAVNSLALRTGVRVGMRAADAAVHLADMDLVP